MGFLKNVFNPPKKPSTALKQEVKLSGDLEELGFSASIQVNHSAVDEKIRTLGKQATQYKRNKDWDKAIDCLKQVKALRKDATGRPTFQSVLRLPKYYMYAERYDEALGACKEIAAQHSTDKKERYKHTVLSSDDFRCLSEVYATMATISHKANRLEDSLIYFMKSKHYESICWKIDGFPVKPSHTELENDTLKVLSQGADLDNEAVAKLWAKILLE